MAALFFSFVLSSSFLPLPPANHPGTAVSFYPDWTPGLVVLETNDTVTCQIRYNQMVPEGLLQVLDGENVLTLSVRDVKCFFFYDANKDRYRKFFTLSVPLDRRRNREIFLEYIYGNDHVSILRHKTMDLAHQYMELSPFRQVVPVNKQYLLNCSTSDVLPISEENAISLLEHRESVLRYIKENGIRFRKLSDYVKVFEYDRSL